MQWNVLLSLPRCQDDPNSFPTRELEETTSLSPYHVSHHASRSESLQPYTGRSSRPGSEPSSVEADVYVWHYALLVVHARKEEVTLRCNGRFPDNYFPGQDVSMKDVSQTSACPDLSIISRTNNFDYFGMLCSKINDELSYARARMITCCWLLL